MNPLAHSSLLIEVDASVSLEELQAALAHMGMTIMQKPNTGRSRITRVPTYLLPAAIADATNAAERGVEHLPRRDGAIVEPLRHRARPKSVADFTYRQGAPHESLG